MQKCKLDHFEDWNCTRNLSILADVYGHLNKQNKAFARQYRTSLWNLQPHLGFSSLIICMILLLTDNTWHIKDCQVFHQCKIRPTSNPYASHFPNFQHSLNERYVPSKKDSVFHIFYHFWRIRPSSSTSVNTLNLLTFSAMGNGNKI